MEDQEATPAGTAVDDVDADTDDAADSGDVSAAQEGGDAGRVPVVALAAALAVLVVFGGVMTTLYLRQSGARADREREVAAQTADLDSVRASLAAAQNQRTLDPTGYDAIKKCIDQAVAEHRLNDEVRKSIEGAGLPTTLPTAPITITTTAIPFGALFLPDGLFPSSDPQICEDAANYVK